MEVKKLYKHAKLFQNNVYGTVNDVANNGGKKKKSGGKRKK